MNWFYRPPSRGRRDAVRPSNARRFKRRSRSLSAEPLEPRLALAVSAVADSYVAGEDVGFATGTTAVVPRRSPGGWAVFDDIPSTGPGSADYPDANQAARWFSRAYDATLPSFGAWEGTLGSGLSAPFAYDIVTVLEPTTQVDAPARRVNTVLARKAFSLTAAQAQATAMTLEFVCDDACAIYLNDREIHRANLPAGAITPQTVAMASGSETAYATVALDLIALGVALHADATNVLAVEVHNVDPLSSDIGFDVSLSIAGGQAGTRANDAISAAIVPVATYYWDGIANPSTTTATSGPVFAADGTTQVGTATIDPATGDFRYEPVVTGLGAGYSGSATFRYVLRDNDIAGTASTATATISIAAANDAPVAAADVYAITAGSGPLSVPAAAGATYISPGSTWYFSDAVLDQDQVNPAWRGPPSGQFNPASGAHAGWDTVPGAAPLGFGNGNEATVLAVDPITYYFFRNFNVPGAIPGTLRLGVRADDCAAVYINGIEVSRSPSLAYGQGFASICTAEADGLAEQTFREVAIPTAGLNLQAAGNTIAVEVHQADNTDAAFDLWLRGGAAGLLANDADPDDPAGELRVEVVDQSQFTPAVGTLAVQPDGSFSFAPAAQIAPGTYSFAYRTLDNGLPVAPAQASRVATATITVLAAPRDRPPIGVEDAYFIDEDQTLIVSRPAPLIRFGDEWSYFDDLQNGQQASPNVAAEAYPFDSAGDNDGTPGASDPWFGEHFSPATSNPVIGAWKVGRGIFAGPIRGLLYGPGTTPLAGVGNAVLPAGQNTVDTYLFRKTFVLDNAASVSQLVLETLVDDGAVFYFNEAAFRLRMPPSGAIAPTTLATGNGDESQYEYRILNVPPGLLRDGVNTLAVEVHQSSRGSSDVGFDLSLSAVPGPGVLANDVDPDGNPLGQATVVRQPAHGVVTMNPDGTFVYTPNANFSGSDGFDYVATAGGATSAPTSVFIGIASVDDPPVALDDAYAVENDETLVVPGATGVLANDTGEETLFVRVDLSGGATIDHAAGRFTWNGVTGSQSNGSFTFVPTPHYVGPFVLTYTIEDSQGRRDTANLTIDVASGAEPGDLDGDGDVDRSDLAVLVVFFGFNGATPAQGDLNGDGRVGAADAVLLRNALAAPSSPAAIVAATGATRESSVDAAMRQLGAARTSPGNDRAVRPRSGVRAKAAPRRADGAPATSTLPSDFADMSAVRASRISHRRATRGGPR